LADAVKGCLEGAINAGRFGVEITGAGNQHARRHVVSVTNNSPKLSS
jgi:hypothetical protein